MLTNDLKHFDLGDVALQSGETLANARIAYETIGELNRRGDNCIVLPTYYTGTHRSYAPLIGPGQAIDPSRWFIIIPNLFANGLSTSPSTAASPAQRARFPQVSIYDNVKCQHALVEMLGVKRIALVAGWSLGGIQSYHWAAMYPDTVDSFLPFCSAARCWPINRVFLSGLRAVLQADSGFADGHYDTAPGLRAFGRVYAGWAYSPQFFRDALYRQLGFDTIEEFFVAWEEEHVALDARDLLAALSTWERADIAQIPPFNGNLIAALGSIKARAIVMPCSEDRYFTLEENKIEVSMLERAELRPFYSKYGHCAGAPGRFPDESAMLVRAFHDLLDAVRTST